MVDRGKEIVAGIVIVVHLLIINILLGWEFLLIVPLFDYLVAMVCIKAQRDNSLAFKNIKIISNNYKKCSLNIFCVKSVSLYIFFRKPSS